MAKTNFQRQKDQKDQAKRRKKEEKLQRKTEKGNGSEPEEEIYAVLDSDGNVVEAEPKPSEDITSQENDGADTDPIT